MILSIKGMCQVTSVGVTLINKDRSSVNPTAWTSSSKSSINGKISGSALPKKSVGTSATHDWVMTQKRPGSSHLVSLHFPFPLICRMRSSTWGSHCLRVVLRDMVSKASWAVSQSTKSLACGNGMVLGWRKDREVKKLKVSNQNFGKPLATFTYRDVKSTTGTCFIHPSWSWGFGIAFAWDRE